MASAMESRTSPTLLGRLRQDPTDETAWAQFVDAYGPRILTWCRKWKLQDAVAGDVTQDVLLKLARKMRTFVYDPARSFRAWLRTLAHHAWRDFIDGRARGGQGTGDIAMADLLDDVEARDDLLRGLEEEFDLE